MADAVPAWKLAILKQKQAKEEGQKEVKTEDKYAGLPQWKKELLIKKEEEAKRVQEKEKERPKGGFSTAPPVLRKRSDEAISVPVAPTPTPKAAPPIEVTLSVRDRLSSLTQARPEPKPAEPTPAPKMNLRSVAALVTPAAQDPKPEPRRAPELTSATDGSVPSLRDRLHMFTRGSSGDILKEPAKSDGVAAAAAAAVSKFQKAAAPASKGEGTPTPAPAPASVPSPASAAGGRPNTSPKLLPKAASPQTQPKVEENGSAFATAGDTDTVLLVSSTSPLVAPLFSRPLVSVLVSLAASRSRHHTHNSR